MEESDHIAYPTAYIDGAVERSAQSDWWWLRSPSYFGKSKDDYFEDRFTNMMITAFGESLLGDQTYKAFIRPAIWVDYKGLNNNETDSENITESSTVTDELQIIEMQTILNKLGYNCGTPDGKVGKMTIGAIEEYQRDKGLEVNGELTEGLYKLLLSEM